jgi:polyphosphate glucokinase
MSRQATPRSLGSQPRGSRPATLNPDESGKPSESPMDTLVIDIGGTNVKIWNSNGTEVVKIPSGKRLTPRLFVAKVNDVTKTWAFDRISIGYAGHVLNGRPAADPVNLGRGWLGFDWSTAFDYPLRIMNDACMQALGSYEGGRMLYLGLGTGIGTVFIIESVVVPLALGHLHLGGRASIDERVSRKGLQRSGPKRWKQAVFDTGRSLKSAFFADYVVFGGGNAKRLGKLPVGFRLGGNQNAYFGGLRMWDDPPLKTAFE